MEQKPQYGPFIGMVFIFNLILGTGALAMPKAFAQAGWILGLILLIIVVFMSFITTTFIVETLACSNAMLKLKILKKHDELKTETNSPIPNASPNQPIVEDELFDIVEVIELGIMTKLFFNRTGYLLFYICICLYLFGDLAIYAVAVPKTLRDVTCTFYPNISHPKVVNEKENETDLCPRLEFHHPCWSLDGLTRFDVYRIYVVVFVCLLGSFVYTNISKTKYLQIFTSLLRWIAFMTLIFLPLKKIISGEGNGNPPRASFINLHSLFGVCVYSFMCHHSLPQMITPINDKSYIYYLLSLTSLIILLFYVLLSFTGIYCFHQLYDLYTLNFQPPKCPYASADFISSYFIIELFLSFFPVFTLSTSFPVIGITLKNNLRYIFGFRDYALEKNSKLLIFLDKNLIPTFVLLVTLIVAQSTTNVQMLVAVTGSYPGAFIQYVVPTFLVYLSRKKIDKLHLAHHHFKMRSPFNNVFWIYLVGFWSIVCLSVGTLNLLIKN